MLLFTIFIKYLLYIQIVNMKALLGMVYAIKRPTMKIANMMEVIAVMQIVRFAVMAIAIQMRLNVLETLMQEVSYL